MGIKLSDYIHNPNEAITNEEWFELYKRAYIDSGESELILAEELMTVSNELDRILESELLIPVDKHSDE